MQTAAYELIKAYSLEPDEVFTWAFGADYRNLGNMDCMMRWNERHGDHFRLSPHDLIKDSLGRIIIAYRQKEA